ncbi:MAG: glycosyltransferase family 2 protein [Polyangiales bacterium]
MTPGNDRERPFFTVIVPTFNRAGMMRRVLGSVTRQRHDAWELVVVDDCSSDDTERAVRALGDPRIRYVRHEVNKGVCAARNTAIDAARGRWLVMLDSDFELLPGALATLERLCRAAPDDVGNVATHMAWDVGPSTPDPSPPGDMLLTYPEFLAWLEGVKTPEWFNCIRREVFDALRYPTGRAYETPLHFAIARDWRFLLVKEKVCLGHTDARDRITRGPPLARARRLLRDAPDWSASVAAMLDAHGAVMRDAAPRMRDRMDIHLANLLLLKGDRAGALAALRRIDPKLSRSPRTLVITALGLLDRRALALAQALRS